MKFSWNDKEQKAAPVTHPKKLSHKRNVSDLPFNTEYNPVQTDVNLPKRNNNNPISKVFPQGRFSEKSTNPFKNGTSDRKTYLDKFNNQKTIIKVVSYKKSSDMPLKTEVDKIFGDNSTFKGSKHMRVNYFIYFLIFFF